MQYIRRTCNLIATLSACAVLALVGSPRPAASAEGPLAGWAGREDWAIEKEKNVHFNSRGTVLHSGAFDGNEDKFSDYYNLELFPNITRVEKRQSPRDDVIAKLRSDLKMCERAPSQDAFNKLTDLTIAYMTRIAGDPRFHPACRVNAMLAIGEVNSPKAAKVLLDTAFDRKPPFAVRVAAMAGLVRMAGPGGRVGTAGVLNDSEIEPLLVNRMVAFAGYHPKSKDDGISWMRGQAADVLGDLGSLGPGGEVPKALLKMLNDKDLPIPLRCKAARALGKLKYGGSTPTAALFLVGLKEFAGDALSSEQPMVVGRTRVRIRQVAHDVLEGIKPFASSPLANDQKLVDSVQKALTQLLKDTESAQSTEETTASFKTARDSLMPSKSEN